MSKCQFIKAEGQECQANAMTGSEYCFMHNPNMETERQIALSKGGSAPRRAYEALSEVKIENTKDVVNLLATTISEVRAGIVELRVANCIGYLSGHLIKAFEVSDFEDRLSRIEKIISS